LIPVSIIGATQDSDVWIAKGNAIADLGKYDEAIKAYDKLIELNPNDSGAWNKKVAALNKSNLIVVNLNKG
jgi:Flp pilus assembly protein TadD